MHLRKVLDLWLKVVLKWHFPQQIFKLFSLFFETVFHLIGRKV